MFEPFAPSSPKTNFDPAKEYERRVLTFSAAKYITRSPAARRTTRMAKRNCSVSTHKTVVRRIARAVVENRYAIAKNTLIPSKPAHRDMHHLVDHLKPSSYQSHL